MFSLRSFFSSDRLIPDDLKTNFLHLYLDIGWFGILSGSAMAFMSVYAARLGATGFQIGLLGAMPAVVNLIFAIPAGQWLQQRAIGKAVFWTSVYYRLGYLLFIPLPWLFNELQQVWALIGLALLMGIPGTALAVGFNALFAEAVPPDWRAYVAGTRNIVLSVVYVITSLVCGTILNWLSFPSGYQIVFGIGFIGAAMSSYHLYHVRPMISPGTKRPGTSTGDLARPGFMRILGDDLRPGVGMRFLIREVGRKLIRTDIWRTPFRKTLVIMLFFHLSQYLAIPLFPIYFVNELKLTDQQIGIGTAMFYAAVLIGSTQLARFSHRFGHRNITGIGVALMSIYPIMLSFSHEVGLFLITSVLGGLVWALVGGAMANYLLEKVPEDDRPAHLAWYNLILNCAILAGSLAGPSIANQVGLGTTLIVFGILRFLSGLSILRWG